MTKENLRVRVGPRFSDELLAALPAAGLAAIEQTETDGRVWVQLVPVDGLLALDDDNRKAAARVIRSFRETHGPDSVIVERY